MKNYLFLGLISLVFSVLILALFLRNPKTKKVELFLICEVSFDDEVERHPLALARNKQQLYDLLGRDHKPTQKFYFKLRSIDYDFGNFDYVFSFGKKIEKLEYGKKLARKYDLCEYLGKIPVFPKYAKGDKHKIYVYGIKEKNIFRTQCP